jgi:EmrB/QacA subfamily drug resistance transporter
MYTYDEASKRSWLVLVLLCLAEFMVILDITAVNVALPSIGDDLGFSTAGLQWVVTAYVLFAGGLLLVGGRAADLLGRRAVFMAGLATFTAASLAAGLAPGDELLLVARALQGIGAAMLTPAALSIVTTTYEGPQRTVALAAWGAIASGGAGAGVLLGGLLTSAFGWESIFFVNVPVGIAVAVLVPRVVARDLPADGERRLDLPGALALVAGLGLLVYGLEGSATHGWGSARTIALLAAGVAVLATFAAIERAVPRPLFPPATWRSRPLVASAGAMLCASGVVGGSFVLNSLYLQHVLGNSAFETGLAFLPTVLAVAGAAHAAGHLLPRLGARAVAVAGLALMSAGALLLLAAPERADYLSEILPGLAVLGLGGGLVFVTATVAAMTDVADADAGLASGLVTTAHEIGVALGVAVLASVAAGAAGAAAGYAAGVAVAAAIAGAVAVVAALAVPPVRPPAGAHAPVH